MTKWQSKILFFWVQLKTFCFALLLSIFWPDWETRFKVKLWKRKEETGNRYFPVAVNLNLCFHIKIICLFSLVYLKWIILYMFLYALISPYFVYLCATWYLRVGLVKVLCVSVSLPVFVSICLPFLVWPFTFTEKLDYVITFSLMINLLLSVISILTA